MPTVRESLDMALQLSIQHATHVCSCEGDECSSDLTGRIKIAPPPDGCTDDEWDRWVASDETDPCPLCNATGVCVAGPYEAQVVSVTLVTLVGFIRQARDKNNFDAMNQAIDWGQVYVLAMAADERSRGLTMVRSLEAVRDGGKLMESVKPDEPPPVGALTPEEIADLTGGDA